MRLRRTANEEENDGSHGQFCVVLVESTGLISPLLPPSLITEKARTSMMAIHDLPDPDTAQETVRDLLQSGSSPYVTLYLPLQRNWNDLQHNRTLLRTLTDEAYDALCRRGLSADQADALLSPARDLGQTPNGQLTDADGLALFLTADFHNAMALPSAPEAASHVDERFHVRPLWRVLAVNGTFFILALAQGGVQLFRASRHAIKSISLPDVPTSLEESTQFDEADPSLGYHTGTQAVEGGSSGMRAPRYFGQEDRGDRAYVKEQILQFFQQLDNGVRKVLRQYTPRPPLVLAGVPYLQGLYRKVNKYTPLLEEGIEGEAIGGPSSRDWDAKALQSAGWRVAEVHFDEERQGALKRYEQVNGAEPSRAAATLSTVVPAALQGRVDTLFVPLRTETWGQFDSTRHAMTIRNDESPQPEDTELYNLATASTLLNSGTVYISENDGAETASAPIRATLRY